MSDVPAVSSPSSDRKSTREKLADLQNMSPKEVTAYLDSKEFAEHGSRAIATNARRIAKIMGGGPKQLSLEDSELLRGAISAIERAKYASGHDVTEAVTKARAYGFDPEKEDPKGGDSMGATATPDAKLEDLPDGSVGDDEDEDEDEDDEDEDGDDATA